jgi:hypothetical protein
MEDLPELFFGGSGSWSRDHWPYGFEKEGDFEAKKKWGPRPITLKANAPPKSPPSLEKSPTVIGPWSNVRSDFSFKQLCLFLACIACTCYIGLEIHCRPKELTKDCRPEEVTEDFCHQIFCLWLPPEVRVLIVLVLVVCGPCYLAAVCNLISDFGYGRRFSAMISSIAEAHQDKSAALFEPYTAELCTGEMEIRFHAWQGRWEQVDDEGWCFDCKSYAEALWGPQGLSDAGTWETSHARERSAEPLTAKSAGSLFEVAWRNANDDPYVTQCRSILEVRLSLSLSCADSETLDKLAADWESFKQANKNSWDDQRYYASVDVKTTLGPASQSGGRRTFAVSGLPCFLGLSYYYVFSVCGLGWLYRLWYSTRNGVVEMHLHQGLRR